MDSVLGISLFLQSVRDALPDAVPVAAFALGDLLNGAAIFLAGSVVLWCVDKRLGQRMLLSFAFGYGINQAIKNLACVYRPWLIDSRLHVEPVAASSATGYSFPSGHTVTVTSIMGSWAANQKTRQSVIVAGALIALIAFLRVFLGAHTVLDVAAAIVVGLVAASFVQLALSWVEGKPGRDIAFAAIVALVAAAVGAYLVAKPYPIDFASDGTIAADPQKMMEDVFKALGMLYGVLVGWLLERRFGGYTTDGSLAIKVKRFVPGALIVGLWFAFGKLAFMAMGLDPSAADFLKHFGLLLLMMGVYPVVISRVQARTSSSRRS